MAKTGATRKGVLNARQLKFIEEYLVDLNATQAAIRAGYSKKTATEQGSRLLTLVHVQEVLQGKQKELAGKRGITRERILDEMAKLAFSDTRQLFDPATGKLLPPHQWPDGMAGAVAGLETVENFGRDSEGNSISLGHTHKVKLWDKGRQLEQLAKHLGLVDDKPTAVTVDLSVLDKLEAKLTSMVPA